jgi:hypothetical protein
MVVHSTTASQPNVLWNQCRAKPVYKPTNEKQVSSLFFSLFRLCDRNSLRIKNKNLKVDLYDHKAKFTIHKAYSKIINTDFGQAITYNISRSQLNALIIRHDSARQLFTYFCAGLISGLDATSFKFYGPKLMQIPQAYIKKISDSCSVNNGVFFSTHFRVPKQTFYTH